MDHLAKKCINFKIKLFINLALMSLGESKCKGKSLELRLYFIHRYVLSVFILNLQFTHACE